MGIENILSLFLGVIISVCLLVLFIFVVISILRSKIIIQKEKEKKKECRKAILQIELIDKAIWIQIEFPLGIAFLLYSLSLESLFKLVWGVFGLTSIAVGFYVLFYQYLPIKQKLREQYKK